VYHMHAGGVRGTYKTYRQLLGSVFSRVEDVKEGGFKEVEALAAESEWVHEHHHVPEAAVPRCAQVHACVCGRGRKERKGRR
jgi:hypothetical protein